jgi:uncharacterized protein (DUF1499 family)
MLPKMAPTKALLALVCLVALTSACAGARPDDLGLTDGRLAPCPESPNCVSSGASDEEHAIEGFRFSSGPTEAWAAAAAAVAGLPGTEIIVQTDDYLHAESTTRLMRYVDDLELHLRAGEQTIAVRSASRVGHSDMGANRERVEALRALLDYGGGLK